MQKFHIVSKCFYHKFMFAMWYSLVWTSHYPYHRILNDIEFKVKETMSNLLDKVWVQCLMPREYKYLHHGVTQLGPQSKFKLKSLQVIIASLRVTPGYLLSQDMEQAHVKMTRQTNKMNRLNTLCIYHWNSFLL